VLSWPTEKKPDADSSGAEAAATRTAAAARAERSSDDDSAGEDDSGAGDDDSGAAGSNGTGDCDMGGDGRGVDAIADSTACAAFAAVDDEDDDGEQAGSIAAGGRAKGEAAAGWEWELSSRDIDPRTLGGAGRGPFAAELLLPPLFAPLLPPLIWLLEECLFPFGGRPDDREGISINAPPDALR